MTEENIQLILKTYNDRKDIEKCSHLASFEEIQKNDFNLNIPRYVDTFEKEEEVDISRLVDEITATEVELEKVNAEVLSGIQQLTSSDEKSKQDLAKLTALLSKEK